MSDWQVLKRILSYSLFHEVNNQKRVSFPTLVSEDNEGYLQLLCLQWFSPMTFMHHLFDKEIDFCSFPFLSEIGDSALIIISNRNFGTCMYLKLDYRVKFGDRIIIWLKTHKFRNTHPSLFSMYVERRQK